MSVVGSTNPQPHQKIQTVCLMVLAAAAIIYLVYWLRPVLVPLVVAWFVVSGLRPILITLEQSLGVNRVIAAGITFLTGMFMLVLFGLALWASVIDLSQNADAYRQRVLEIVQKVEDSFPDQWAATFLNKGLLIDGSSPAKDQPDLKAPLDLTAEQPADPDPAGLAAEPSELAEAETSGETTARGSLAGVAPPPVLPPASGLGGAIGKSRAGRFLDSILRDGISVISQALLGLFSSSVIVLIYVFFLLIGSPDKSSNATLNQIDFQVRSYLSLKTGISLVTGFAFGMTLWLFGVPMALTFGVLAFLLNFIPNVGPLLATILPLPLVVLHPQAGLGWMAAVMVTASAIQLISGNVIEPKLMGDSSDLHPVTILLALMFWGIMWGTIGMFLATPITAGIKLVLQRLDATRPLADLMAGRLASSVNAASSADSAGTEPA
ncbi:AI-2E family transporter [Planctomycetaceae bacterium SH139]